MEVATIDIVYTILCSRTDEKKSKLYMAVKLGIMMAALKTITQ
jgi:hypothetical protein